MSASVMGSLRDLAASLGVGRLYRRLRLASLRWRLPRPYAFEIDGTEVTFQVASLPELRAIKHTVNNEREPLRELLADVRGGDVFLDVGANLGVYGCFCCRTGADVTVVSVEPHPSNVPGLRQHMADSCGEATIIEGALSDATGEVPMDLGEGEVEGAQGATIGEHVADDEATVDVQTFAGDELVADGEIPQPTLVKIDVEGAEMEVIDGLADVLTRESCRTIYCEVHSGKEERRRVEVTRTRRSAGGWRTSASN